MPSSYIVDTGSSLKQSASRLRELAAGEHPTVAQSLLEFQGARRPDPADWRSVRDNGRSTVTGLRRAIVSAQSVSFACPMGPVPRE